MPEYKQPLALPVVPDYYRGDPSGEPPPEPPAIRIFHYLWILKRYRWQVLGFIGAAMGIVWLVSAFVLTPIWESSATVTIPATDQAATQSRMVQSDAVLRPVVNQYQLLDREEQLKQWVARDPEAPLVLRNLRVANPPNTSLLLITYQSPDRHRAAAISNAIARSYVLHSLTEQFRRHLDTLKATLLATLRQLEADRTKIEADRLAKQAAARSAHGGAGPASKAEVEYQEALRAEAAIQSNIAKNQADLDHLNARFAEYQEMIRQSEKSNSLFGDGNSPAYDDLFSKVREAGIDAGMPNSGIAITDIARPGSNPISPHIKLNVFLAFLFSAILAAAAAVTIDRMDQTVRDPDQVRALLDLPAIGTLPPVEHWSGKDALALGAPSRKEVAREITSNGQGGARYEASVDGLRETLLLGSFGRPIHSILFTSANPSEGKTNTAVHLALAHAKLNHKTLLIDANFRHPGVHHKLGISVETGFGMALQNGLPWQMEIVSMGNLDIVPAGRSNRHAAALIGGSLPQILNESESTYDLVIVDAPAVLGLPEVADMSTAVDGVVLVATSHKTSRAAVASAAAILQQARASLLGLVLNEYEG